LRVFQSVTNDEVKCWATLTTSSVGAYAFFSPLEECPQSAQDGGERLHPLTTPQCCVWTRQRNSTCEGPTKAQDLRRVGTGVWVPQGPEAAVEVRIFFFFFCRWLKGYGIVTSALFLCGILFVPRTRGISKITLHGTLVSNTRIQFGQFYKLKWCLTSSFVTDWIL
jgi:hypothetical protein